MRDEDVSGELDVKEGAVGRPTLKPGPRAEGEDETETAK